MKTKRTLGIMGKSMKTLACGAVAMTLSAYASPTVQAANFNDTWGHWAESQIDRWASYGVIEGYNGYFRPNDPITRAEMAVILNSIMDYQIQSTTYFSDLGDGEWYTSYVRKLNSAGFMMGADGTIRPYDSITREEAAVVIANAFHYDVPSTESGVTNTVFTDNSDIAYWAKNSVNVLYQNGIVSGRGGNYFDPKSNVTRAEVAQMLDNIVGTFINTPQTISGVNSTTMVINTAGVTLSNLTIYGDLILAEGIADGDIELENVTVTGNIIIKGGSVATVYVDDVTVYGRLEVARVDAPTLVKIRGKSTIPTVDIMNNCVVDCTELDDGYELGDVTIYGEDDVTLLGKFDSIVNKCPNVKLTVSGTVNTFYMQSNGTVNGSSYPAGSYVDPDSIPGGSASEAPYIYTTSNFPSIGSATVVVDTPTFDVDTGEVSVFIYVSGITNCAIMSEAQNAITLPDGSKLTDMEVEMVKDGEDTFGTYVYEVTFTATSYLSTVELYVNFKSDSGAPDVTVAKNFDSVTDDDASASVNVTETVVDEETGEVTVTIIVSNMKNCGLPSLPTKAITVAVPEGEDEDDYPSILSVVEGAGSTSLITAYEVTFIPNGVQDTFPLQVNFLDENEDDYVDLAVTVNAYMPAYDEDDEDAEPDADITVSSPAFVTVDGEDMIRFRIYIEDMVNCTLPSDDYEAITLSDEDSELELTIELSSSGTDSRTYIIYVPYDEDLKELELDMNFQSLNTVEGVTVSVETEPEIDGLSLTFSKWDSDEADTIKGVIVANTSYGEYVLASGDPEDIVSLFDEDSATDFEVSLYQNNANIFEVSFKPASDVEDVVLVVAYEQTSAVEEGAPTFTITQKMGDSVETGLATVTTEVVKYKNATGETSVEVSVTSVSATALLETDLTKFITSTSDISDLTVEKVDDENYILHFTTSQTDQVVNLVVAFTEFMYPATSHTLTWGNTSNVNAFMRGVYTVDGVSLAKTDTLDANTRFAVDCYAGSSYYVKPIVTATIDGVKVTLEPNADGTYTMPNGDTHVTAYGYGISTTTNFKYTWAAYEVGTTTSVLGGSVGFRDSTGAPVYYGLQGDVTTVTASDVSGYTFSHFDFGNAASNNGTDQFTVGTAAVQVIAYYTKGNTYTVSKAEDNFTLFAQGALVADGGIAIENAQIQVVPNSDLPVEKVEYSTNGGSTWSEITDDSGYYHTLTADTTFKVTYGEADTSFGITAPNDFTVQDEDGNPVTSAEEGEEVTVKLPSGKTWDDYIISPSTLTPQPTGSEDFTFTMPAEKVEITEKTPVTPYDISAPSGFTVQDEDGNGITSAVEGDKVTVKLPSDKTWDDYIISPSTLTPQPTGSEDFTFTMPAEKVEITANVPATTYDITVPSDMTVVDENGAGITQAKAGDTVKITLPSDKVLSDYVFTPSGLALTYVTGTNDYTFTMPEGDVTVVDNSATVISSIQTTISGSNPDDLISVFMTTWNSTSKEAIIVLNNSVVSSEVSRVTITSPTTGIVLGTAVVNGTTITVPFTSMNEDLGAIDVVLDLELDIQVAVKYTLNITQDDNDGTVTVYKNGNGAIANGGTMEEGDTFRVDVVAPANKTLGTITVSDSSGTITADGSGYYTVGTSNVTVAVTYDALAAGFYNITKLSEGNVPSGSSVKVVDVAANNGVDVNSGEKDKTYQVVVDVPSSADADYEYTIDVWDTANNVAVSVGTDGTFTMPEGAITVTVNYQVTGYAVYKVAVNGDLDDFILSTGSNTNFAHGTKVAEGQTVSISLPSDSTKTIDKIYVNSVLLGTDVTTFTVGAETMSVVVVFEGDVVVTPTYTLELGTVFTYNSTNYTATTVTVPSTGVAVVTLPSGITDTVKVSTGGAVLDNGTLTGITLDSANLLSGKLYVELDGVDLIALTKTETIYLTVALEEDVAGQVDTYDVTLDEPTKPSGAVATTVVGSDGVSVIGTKVKQGDEITITPPTITDYTYEIKVEGLYYAPTNNNYVVSGTGNVTIEIIYRETTTNFILTLTTSVDNFTVVNTDNSNSNVASGSYVKEDTKLQVTATGGNTIGKVRVTEGTNTTTYTMTSSTTTWDFTMPSVDTTVEVFYEYKVTKATDSGDFTATIGTGTNEFTPNPEITVTRGDTVTIKAVSGGTISSVTVNNGATSVSSNAFTMPAGNAEVDVKYGYKLTISGGTVTDDGSSVESAKTEIAQGNSLEVTGFGSSANYYEIKVVGGTSDEVYHNYVINNTTSTTITMPAEDATLTITQVYELKLVDAATVGKTGATTFMVGGATFEPNYNNGSSYYVAENKEVTIVVPTPQPGYTASVSAVDSDGDVTITDYKITTSTKTTTVTVTYAQFVATITVGDVTFSDGSNEASADTSTVNVTDNVITIPLTDYSPFYVIDTANTNGYFGVKIESDDTSSSLYAAGASISSDGTNHNLIITIGGSASANEALDLTIYFKEVIPTVTAKYVSGGEPSASRSIVSTDVTVTAEFDDGDDVGYYKVVLTDNLATSYGVNGTLFDTTNYANGSGITVTGGTLDTTDIAPSLSSSPAALTFYVKMTDHTATLSFDVEYGYERTAGDIETSIVTDAAYYVDNVNSTNISGTTTVSVGKLLPVTVTIPEDLSGDVNFATTYVPVITFKDTTTSDVLHSETFTPVTAIVGVSTYTYTYTMPSNNVTISVDFVGIVTEATTTATVKVYEDEGSGDYTDLVGTFTQPVTLKYDASENETTFYYYLPVVDGYKLVVDGGSGDPEDLVELTIGTLSSPTINTDSTYDETLGWYFVVNGDVITDAQTSLAFDLAYEARDMLNIEASGYLSSNTLMTNVYVYNKAEYDAYHSQTIAAYASNQLSTISQAEKGDEIVVVIERQDAMDEGDFRKYQQADIKITDLTLTALETSPSLTYTTACGTHDDRIVFDFIMIDEGIHITVIAPSGT